MLRRCCASGRAVGESPGQALSDKVTFFDIVIFNIYNLVYTARYALDDDGFASVHPVRARDAVWPFNGDAAANHASRAVVSFLEDIVFCFFAIVLITSATGIAACSTIHALTLPTSTRYVR
jgi:hypothetical protein